MMLMIIKNLRENRFQQKKVLNNQNFSKIKNKIILTCYRVWAYLKDYKIWQESIESKKVKNKI